MGVPSAGLRRPQPPCSGAVGVARGRRARGGRCHSAHRRCPTRLGRRRRAGRQGAPRSAAGADGRSAGLDDGARSCADPGRTRRGIGLAARRGARARLAGRPHRRHPQGGLVGAAGRHRSCDRGRPPSGLATGAAQPGDQLARVVDHLPGPSHHHLLAGDAMGGHPALRAAGRQGRRDPERSRHQPVAVACHVSTGGPGEVGRRWTDAVVQRPSGVREGRPHRARRDAAAASQASRSSARRGRSWLPGGCAARPGPSAAARTVGAVRGLVGRRRLERVGSRSRPRARTVALRAVRSRGTGGGGRGYTGGRHRSGWARRSRTRQSARPHCAVRGSGRSCRCRHPARRRSGPGPSHRARSAVRGRSAYAWPVVADATARVYGRAIRDEQALRARTGSVYRDPMPDIRVREGNLLREE